MGAVSQAVRQVGADRGHDAGAQAPRCQSWYTVVAPTRVQHHHGRCPDQTVHGERQQPGGHASLAVRADEFVGVLVGDDRSDAGHGHDRERRGDPDEPVGHRGSSWSGTLMLLAIGRTSTCRSLTAVSQNGGTAPD
jgi:hypothetical protein